MNHEPVLLSLALLAASSPAYDVRLSGTVFDASGGAVLGARVRLAGTKLSTATAADGRWFLVARMEGTDPGSDTLLLSWDDGSPVSTRLFLSTLERGDIVSVLEAAPLPLQPPTRLVQPLAPTSEPTARTGETSPPDPPAAPKPPPPKQTPRPPRSPLQGRELMDWDRPLPPGAFACGAGFAYESWTGTYEDGPILDGEPSAQEYALDLRLGLPDLRPGAWSEVHVREAVLLRNADALDQDGIGSPEIDLRLGLAKWCGAKLAVLPPWGSSGIVGNDPAWNFGAGSFLALSGRWVQLHGEAMYHFGPGLLTLAGRPQVTVADWAAVHADLSYRRVFHDSRPAYLGAGFHPLDETKDTYSLLELSPGVRLRLGRHTGLDLSAPFTLSGRKTVAHWGLQAGIREAFGL